MQVDTMQCYSGFLRGLFEASVPSLTNGDVSAHILAPTYQPDLSAHKTLADIISHELQCADYSPQRMTGQHLLEGSGPDLSWTLSSDIISFGDPITLPVFRYLVFATGLPGLVAANKGLIAVADLAPNGAREVVSGALEFLPGSDGWLSLSSSVQA